MRAIDIANSAIIFHASAILQEMRDSFDEPLPDTHDELVDYFRALDNRVAAVQAMLGAVRTVHLSKPSATAADVVTDGSIISQLRERVAQKKAELKPARKLLRKEKP
jgi:hypothetical protein